MNQYPIYKWNVFIARLSLGEIEFKKKTTLKYKIIIFYPKLNNSIYFHHAYAPRIYSVQI